MRKMDVQNGSPNENNEFDFLEENNCLDQNVNKDRGMTKRDSIYDNSNSGEINCKTIINTDDCEEVIIPIHISNNESNIEDKEGNIMLRTPGRFHQISCSSSDDNIEKNTRKRKTPIPIKSINNNNSNINSTSNSNRVDSNNDETTISQSSESSTSIASNKDDEDTVDEEFITDTVDEEIIKVKKSKINNKTLANDSNEIVDLT
jgi:hypothetical protein